MSSTHASTWESLGIDLEGREGEVDVFCPQCVDQHANRKRTLSVNTDSGKFHCPRCDFKGRAGGRLSRGEWRARARAECAATTARDREGAARALALWESGKPVESHQYLTRKRVSAHGLRKVGAVLLVPMVDVDGKVWNIQRIRSDGSKKWDTGRLRGLMFPIKRLPECENRRIFVAEGYATASSLHEHFYPGAATVVAFCADNLKAVALELAHAYPRTELVIAADNDQWTKGNPGVTRAREAAAAVYGTVIIPDFTGLDLSGSPTDFNDLALLLAKGRA